MAFTQTVTINTNVHDPVLIIRSTYKHIKSLVLRSVSIDSNVNIILFFLHT